jgi:hypothetical protein
MKIKLPKEVAEFLVNNGDMVYDKTNTYYRFTPNWYQKTDIDDVFETELEPDQIKLLNDITTPPAEPPAVDG